MNDDLRQALRDELNALRTAGARRQELSQHACKRLFFDFGIRPSMATVRDLTQTGSASDIPKDIDAFWARIRSASRVRIDGASIPEALQERAGELLGLLFEDAQRHAHASLDSYRDEARAVVEASEDRIRDADARSLAMEEALRRSEANAAAGMTRIAALEAEVGNLRSQETQSQAGVQSLIRRLESENDALTRRLEQEQSSNAALRDRIDALQTDMRDSTESYARQIKDAVSEAERRVKPMLVELDALRGASASFQASVRDASHKEFDFMQQLSAARGRADRLEVQVRSQSDEIDALSRTCDALRQRAGTPPELGELLCTLVAEGRLNDNEIAALGTQLDAHVALPARARPVTPENPSCPSTRTNSNCSARIAIIRRGPPVRDSARSHAFACTSP